MFEIIAKVWFLIFVLPLNIAKTGYEKLKKFLAKHGYRLDWAWTTLFILVLVLILVLVARYGYN